MCGRDICGCTREALETPGVQHGVLITALFRVSSLQLERINLYIVFESCSNFNGFITIIIINI